MINLKKVKTIFVHWSESEAINTELGYDENGDINSFVDPIYFDELVRLAACSYELEYSNCYDKTVLSIILVDGTIWADKLKFYITKKTKDLVDLLDY